MHSWKARTRRGSRVLAAALSAASAAESSHTKWANASECQEALWTIGRRFERTDSFVLTLFIFKAPTEDFFEIFVFLISHQQVDFVTAVRTGTMRSSTIRAAALCVISTTCSEAFDPGAIIMISALGKQTGFARAVAKRPILRMSSARSYFVYRSDDAVLPVDACKHACAPFCLCSTRSIAGLQHRLRMFVLTIRHVYSEDGSDMVSRRVNAIMEATPMHLITAYFEHAYEISAHQHTPAEEIAELERSLAAANDFTCKVTSTGFPSTSSVMSEDARDILKRVQSWEGPLSAAMAPTPSAAAYEDAESVLRRVNIWMDSAPVPTTSNTPVCAKMSFSTAGPSAHEDVASILARADAMERNVLATCQAATPLQCVNNVAACLADTSCSTAPVIAAPTVGKTLNILARAKSWMRPNPLAAPPATPTPSTLKVAVHAECAASVLARVNAMSSTAGFDVVVASPSSLAACALPVEDAQAVLARVNAMTRQTQDITGWRAGAGNTSDRHDMSGGGKWALERTPRTCCEWERNLVKARSAQFVLS